MLVQYGQRRIVIATTDNLIKSIKDAFKISNEANIVLQLFDDEWKEYIDINTDTFSEILKIHDTV